MIEKTRNLRLPCRRAIGYPASPTSRRHNPQQDASARHGFSNNMSILFSSSRATLLALSSLLTLTISLGGIISLLDNQILRAVIVAAAEV